MSASGEADPLDPRALQAELHSRDAELAALREELEETNRGVVALYAELADQAEQLRQMAELKSRFFSYMSHEFRTPLGAIRSLARLLLDRMDGPLTEEQERQVLFMRSAAEELTGMVDDLLDLAKIEAGRITVSPAWFGMVDLFGALRGMFKPIAMGLPVTLIFEEPKENYRFYNDDKKLTQILRNFISNAIKFTPRGEIHVRVTHDGGDFVCFSVRDTGIGIAPEHLDSLFKDFSQLDSAVQRQWRGTGLGLALSRKLAELLGGQVFVESELGVGSTFSVSTPLVLKVPSQAGAAAGEREE